MNYSLSGCTPGDNVKVIESLVVPLFYSHTYSGTTCVL